MKVFAATLAFALVVGALVAAYFFGRQAPAAAQKIEAAQDRATVADLNTQGAKQSEQRVHVTVDAQQRAAGIASQLQAVAITAGDANVPLDPARANRLRAVDRALCATSPDLDGCPAR